uniref:Uncharacterized mitochondrial protein AtMg00810-like n=1 Tax=Tanacetum cinerariifolium TaxID=118510 RepID=A0A6L2NUW6_TANCI|nr:uncharacterized mitochondrial protein AtMg00810-like [Tanacetum cinerariifolium]
MNTQKSLLKDEDGEEVDVHMYRLMIGSLMYLISLIPDIMFAVCTCARYQVNLKVARLYAVKRIFSYLKGQLKLGLWYLKDSPFDLVAYTDSDYARASLDRKFTTGGCQYLRCRLISWQCKKQTVVEYSTTEAEYVAASKKPTESEGFEQIVDFLSAHTLRYALIINPTIYDSCIELFWSTAMAKTINGEAKIHAWVDGKEMIITKSSVRRDLQLADEEGVDCLPNSIIFENLELMGKPKRKNTQVPYPIGSIEHVVDEAVYKELDDRLVRAVTIVSSLEAEQYIGNIDKTPSKVTPNEASSPGTTSGGGLRCQEAIGDTISQTRFENVSKLSNDSLLARARVDSFKDEQSLGEDASKQGRKINDIDADEDITLVNDQNDAKMFDVNNLHGEEAFVVKEVLDKEVSAAGEVNAARIATTVSAVAIITTEEITLAQALMEIKRLKPKAKGIVLQEPSESTITTTTKTISLKQSQDKGKAIMIEEPTKLKKKDQIRLDEESALKLQAELQAEFDEQRLARESSKGTRRQHCFD